VAADLVSVIVRALSFIALFQAAGIALFLAGVTRGSAFHSDDRLRDIGTWSAGAAMVLVLAHYLLESARMAGDLAGVLDPSLQSLVLESSTSAALGLRLSGLALLLVAFRMDGNAATPLSLAGVVLVLTGFVAVGHTSTHSPRIALALLLLFHLAVVAFWFGAIVPLHITATREVPQTAARIVERFSSLAIWLVPGLFIAGLALAVLILPNLAALGTAYGQLLILKVIGFSLLLGLASLNKWRLGPALGRGDYGARRAFCGSLVAEAVLIAAVLAATAAMTSLYSPEG
jgi:putative copper resistance protein D